MGRLEKDRTREQAEFNDFKQQWHDGTIESDHPTGVRVKRLSSQVAESFDRPNDAVVLESLMLTNLANANYEGKNSCSLNHYIWKSLVRLEQHLVRKDPEHDSIDDDDKGQPKKPLLDPSTLKAEQIAAIKIAIKKLFEEFPELERAIGEILLDNGWELSERDLADEATKKLGKKVGRHKAKKARAVVWKAFTTSLWPI